MRRVPGFPGDRRSAGARPAPTCDERLEQRIERLEAQFEWGDIGADEYRRKMLGARTELASLPEPEKVVTFDRVAAIVTSLEQATRVASPPSCGTSSGS